MYEYELHQLNVAELIRRADVQRTVRQAVLARRASRRSARRSGPDEIEGQVGRERGSFVHAA